MNDISSAATSTFYLFKKNPTCYRQRKHTQSMQTSHFPNVCLSSAYDKHSNVYYLLPFPFIDMCNFSEALPLPMDIPPLIRPVLPSPLKHDGTRRAGVTQCDFFIELRTNTFAHTQTKTTQRQTSSDHGTR